MIDSSDTVTVAIFAGSTHVLLLQRDPNEYSGHGNKWELVGGHIHENELAEEAAIREVCEETGIANISLQYANISLFVVDGQEVANVIYLARLSSEVLITLSPEHQAYRWTPIVEALQMPLACKHSAILQDLVLEGDA